MTVEEQDQWFQRQVVALETIERHLLRIVQVAERLSPPRPDRTSAKPAGSENYVRKSLAWIAEEERKEREGETFDWEKSYPTAPSTASNGIVDPRLRPR